jgi:hypothetical protein
MSLTDAAARAMAVKMLNDSEIRRMHERELERGYHFLPYEVAKFSALAREKNISINAWWGIPSHSTSSQAMHAERITGLVFSMIREKKCQASGELEEMHDFDWHIHRSAIDFVCESGHRSARSEVENAEEIFGEPSDRKSNAAGE